MNFKVAEIKSAKDGEPVVKEYTIDDLARKLSHPEKSLTNYQAYHFQKVEEKRLSKEASLLKLAGNVEEAKALKLAAKGYKDAQVATKDGAAIMPFIFEDDVTFKDVNGWKQRDNSRIEQFSLVVLDIESKISKEQIHDVLSKHEYMIWSTISHRPDDPRFRVILFLQEPLLVSQAQALIYRIDACLPANNQITAKTQAIDPASLEAGRLMYYPKWLTGHPEKYFFFHNRGKLLEVTDFELTSEQQLQVQLRAENAQEQRKKKQAEILTRSVASSSSSSSALKTVDGVLYLDPDGELSYDGGWVTVKDINGKISNVSCPAHGDVTGSEFVDVNQNNRPYLHCKNCGTIRMFVDKTETLTFKKKVTEEVKKIEALEPTFNDTVNEIVTPQQRAFQKPISMADRAAKIAKFTRTVLARPERHFVLRTPQGYGKSTVIVKELLAKGLDVLFCCSSNKQALEKLTSFKEHNPARCVSLGGLLEEKLNVRPIMSKTRGFAASTIDMQATANVIQEKWNCDEQEALNVLNELRDEAAASRFLTSRLVVTTFAMGDMLFRSNAGRLNRVIVVDDPNSSDLITFMFEGEATEVEEHTRDAEEVIFGPDFWGHDKIIWTTTEKITAALIKKHHEECYVRNIAESIDTEKRILLYPTTMVTAKLKKILGGSKTPGETTGIHHCVLDHTKEEHIIIGNGLENSDNLVSTKGSNALVSDACVVVSHPHPYEVMAVCNSLETFDQRAVSCEMIVDVLDQAIGRAQGYRGNDEHYTLVLCHPQHEVYLKNHSIYKLNTQDGLKRKGRLHGAVIEWAEHYPKWWTRWIQYLAAWQNYVVVIGDRVYNTLDLRSHSITPEEAKKIKHELTEPTKFGSCVWKHITAYVEGEGRKNISLSMSELVSKFNLSQQKTAASTFMKKTNEKRTGQVTCIDSAGRKFKLKVGDVMPLDCRLANVKHNTLTPLRVIAKRVSKREPQ